MPAPHGMHADSASLPSSVLNVPAAQSEHTLLAESVSNLPLGHFSHSASPGTPLNSPGSHDTQPSRSYGRPVKPTAHSFRQLPLSPRPFCSGLDVRPSGHAWHCATSTSARSSISV